jgi:uncharacterized Zn-binding protein involved in type VI secretion
LAIGFDGDFAAMGKPAARITDSCSHMMAPMTPGIGAITVLIGKKPAWRAVNPAAAAALMAANAANQATVTAAEAAAKAAAPTPGAPAALAAEAAAKGAALAAFAGAMSGAMAPSPSGGVPDIHACMMPSVPPGLAPVPHGPGMVIDGSLTVLVNGLPLARVGDTILEAFGTPPNKIVMGEFTVLIG